MIDEHEERLRAEIIYDGFYSELGGNKAVSLNPWPLGSKKWHWWNEGADKPANGYKKQNQELPEETEEVSDG